MKELKEEIKEPEEDPEGERYCTDAIDELTRGLESAENLQSDEIKAKIYYKLGHI